MADDREQIIDYREVGSTGLRRFSGFVYEEFLRELTGWKGCAVYKEMAYNDPTVSAVLYAITMLCRKVEWTIEPASEHPEDLEAADFLESCMYDMSDTWNDTITNFLSFLLYGFSYHEIVYKRRCGDGLDPSRRSKFRDGRIGWRKLPIRSQDTIYRWQFDDHGGIQGAEQLAPPHYYLTVLPIEKALLFRTTTQRNNPEGLSCFRGAYRPWYMKKNIENIEAIGIERDLAGLPMALVPPEILSSKRSAEQTQLYNQIQDIVVNIRRDAQEGVIFPSAYDTNGKLMYELKLLSTGGTRQFDTDKVINRYDQRIAMTCLADFILLGQEKVGSFALSSSKTQLFTTAIGAHLDMIAETMNRYAVPRLFALNDFEISDYPKFKHADIEQTNLQELGDFIQKLASAGMPLFPDPALEKDLRMKAGLPEPIDPTRAEDRMEGVTPLPVTRPKRILEIPDNPLQTPTLNPTADTTPVNGAPAEPRVTNQNWDDEVGQGEFLRFHRRTE